MAHMETKTAQSHREGIDLEILEKYMVKVSSNTIKLLEEHTNLINRLYEHGLADFNDAVHLQHINKRLSRKIRIAYRAKPKSLVQQATELAIKEAGAGNFSR